LDTQRLAERLQTLSNLRLCLAVKKGRERALRDHPFRES